MNKIVLIIVAISLYFQANAQNTDANITGHVTSGNEHLPYVNIFIKGTNLGTLTDETGHYNLVNLPIGEHTLIFSFVGYKPLEKIVNLKENITLELKVNLESDLMGLNEVVITGDRTLESRSESPVIVQTIGTEMIESTQSTTLGESLNFSSGIRTENNCSNCGFSQVRMNGLEGPYSQILINSRPIFSGLAGVYGLEMIPVNMIEKIEVVKGGGSALYGSNAIAGTINLIMADPYMNSYEAGITTSLIGAGLSSHAMDNTINFNTTIVSKNYRTGLSLYGFNRSRDAWDANGDGFSEMVMIKNTTFGARFNQHLGDRSKIAMDFFNIKEKRRGGNNFENLNHEADIAEAVEHNITTGALTFERHMRKNDMFSIFVSGQKVNRDSYYGAHKSVSDYGTSHDLTVSLGTQYKMLFANAKLIAGIEYTVNELEDLKLGYPILLSDSTIQHTENTTIVDQSSKNLGTFLQYEYKWKQFKFSGGARFDKYLIQDYQDVVEDKDGDVLSPRVNIMYDIRSNLKVRASFSRGYRAPQIFDEDLHIETSGSRKVIHRNDPNLVAEKSHSIMASIEYYKQVKDSYFNVLIEGFYTKLNNPFANEVGAIDNNGVVIYTRVNAKSGAIIQGVNAELGFYPSDDIKINFGGTFQSSQYEEEQDFNEKSFFRTPNAYGFVAADYDIGKKWCISVSGNYTGKMLVPYYGQTITNPELGELRESPDFFDLGIKVRYTMNFSSTKIQLFGGVKNILNAYQNDHELGIEKDPAYIYGPAQPRTIYIGLKLGNLL